MNEIIEGVTSKYGLDSSSVCSNTIRRRETRYNNVTVHRMNGGHISPMIKVEDKLVGLIIQMTRIRYPLTNYVHGTFFRIILRKPFIVL